MTDRIQLTQPVYMKLDGQWRIVYGGSVMDVPSAGAFSAQHVTILSPSEPAGTLAAHGGPTPVRNIRTR